MFLRLLVLSFILIFQGCTGAVNNSTLLSAFTPCKENCTTSDPGTISGELEILPDSGEIFASPEGSDLVEVSGSCKDLGRKANRILVQVYEGEDDSVAPIIDNSIGLMCQDNISTSSLQSTAGVGKTCMLIAQGIGLADTGSSVSQYPQCFNGRFSFQLRMGRIIRRDTGIADNSDATNPKVRYLVKMKLRTTDSITSDSAPTTMFVSRQLQTPNFSITQNRSNDRCEIKFSPSKFRDIRYTLTTTWTGPSWGASGTFTNSVSGAVYVDKEPTFPPLGNGTTVENFYHFGEPLDPTIGLMPGMTYTYQLRSADYSYRFTGNPAITDYEQQFAGGASATAVERSNLSGSLSCVMDPAYVGNRNEQNQGAGTPNSCLLTLAGFNTRGYKLEWRVGMTANWMQVSPNSGMLISTGGDSNCRSLSTCFVHGDRAISSATTYIDPVSGTTSFQPMVPYYFAARHYRDTNGNNLYDVGELVGEWSPPTAVSDNENDFNHRCTFNTFPVN